MRPLKRFKVTRSKERLSNRIGLRLVEEIIEHLDLRKAIDQKFPKPGSNRGLKASYYITTLVYKFMDGAVHLEDVNHLWNLPIKMRQKIILIKQHLGCSRVY
jgi:hypothetical protein